MVERELIEPTEDEKRNGWTAETLTEYVEGVERAHQAQHFGGSYGDPDLDDHMRKVDRAKRMRVEPALSRNPKDW